MNTTTEAKKAEQIKDAGFSYRTGNVLFRAGIFTIGDLCCLSETELFRLPGCGVKTFNEIMTYLNEQGLELKTEEDPVIPVEVSWGTYGDIFMRLKNYYLTQCSENSFTIGDIILFTAKDEDGNEYQVRRAVQTISQNEEGLVDGYVILGF